MCARATNESVSPPSSAPARIKWLQVAGIVALVVAASVGGAFYYYRYGDKTSADANVITDATKQMLSIEIPPQLWPRLTVTRPDVMTMVAYATKNDQACLAVACCVPEWAHQRENRPNQVLQSALQQYFPQFETERWKDTETREVSIRGQNEKVKVASSYRVEDHKEVRVVSIENLVTDKGTIALYYQTAITSTADDEIEAMLKSLK